MGIVDSREFVAVPTVVVTTPVEVRVLDSEEVGVVVTVVLTSVLDEVVSFVVVLLVVIVVVEVFKEVSVGSVFTDVVLIAFVNSGVVLGIVTMVVSGVLESVVVLGSEVCKVVFDRIVVSVIMVPVV